MEKQVEGLSAKNAFRLYLNKKFGGAREAMREFDPNGNASVSFEEFRSAPDCAGEELNLFNGAGFLLDIEHEDWAAVYPEPE